MQYRKLAGVCKEAIEKSKCLGCQQLEDKYFVGVKECNNLLEFKDKQLSEQLKIDL